eukprot:2794847-Pyramimonas_sp.AAC.1
MPANSSGCAHWWPLETLSAVVSPDLGSPNFAAEISVPSSMACVLSRSVWRPFSLSTFPGS